jgi:hypothetical protein
VIAAWDWRNGQFTRRWTSDSNANSGYTGQGNHQSSVADVDGHGKDEVVYGTMAVDDNGNGLWTTGDGHGDAMHVGDLDPSRPGPEEFKVDEDSSKPSSWTADARTGQILWSTPAGGDNGRGVSGDIWSGSAGAESWSSLVSGVRNPKGVVAASRKPGPSNFLAWWDGDTSGDTRLLTGSGVHSNNGTKSTPSFVRRRPRRLVRGGHLADVQPHGPADPLHAVPDQYADHDPPPRHPVPNGSGLAEHCLQPAPAPQLLHRRQHAYATPPHRRAAGQPLSRTEDFPGA